MRRLLIFLTLITAATSSNAATYETLNATCVFNRLVTYGLTDQSVRKDSVTQTMTISNGQTTEETLLADGSIRATNSKSWTFVSGLTWVGNFGEMLTIDGFGKGWGSHQAVLQSTVGSMWAYGAVGVCTGNFDDTKL